MPNWCYSKYAFFTNDEDKSELARLHKNLVDIIKTQSQKKNDFEPGWLGKVAMKHGFDWEQISCRGYIEELGEYEPGDSYFTLSGETAWGPTDDLWEAVIEQYKGISFVYVAEEPGNGVYINTDTDGVYFTDRFLMDIYGDVPIPEGWYPNQEKPVALEIHEYFDSFEDLNEYCTHLTGKSFDTLEKLSDYFNEVFADEGDVIFGIHEYTAA